jgi:hypothetical protein
MTDDEGTRGFIASTHTPSASAMEMTPGNQFSGIAQKIERVSASITFGKKFAMKNMKA